MPQNQVTRYVDAESDKDILTYPTAVRRRYEDAMHTFLKDLSSAYSRSQIDYLKLISTDSLGLTLARYLEHRERMG